MKKTMYAAGLVVMVTAATGAGQLTMTWEWDNPTNEFVTTNVVERSIGGSNSFVAVATIPVTNVWTDTNLVKGTVYCYRIRAVNAAGTSTPSEVSCALALTAPRSPYLKKVTVDIVR